MRQPGGLRESAIHHRVPIKAEAVIQPEGYVVYTVGRKAAEGPAVATGDQQARHAAAMAQVLAVVEGLEEELHAAEAACHDAERDSHTSGRSATV